MSGNIQRIGLSGIWTHRAFRPLIVSDPAELGAFMQMCNLLTEDVSRSLERLRLSEKNARRLVKSLYDRGLGDPLRRLEKLLSGGGLKWEESYENIVVNEGLDHLLDVTLSGGTQDTSWFLGLLAATPTPLATWTATEIASNDFTDYSEATLQAWTDGGVSGQSVTNPTPATFTCDTDTSVIGGAYLIQTNAKITPAGTLYAAGEFTGGNKNLDNLDTIDVTATFQSADDGV